MKIWFGLLLAPFLVSCVSPPPRSQAQPSVPLPELWTANPALSGPISNQWWISFGEPELVELIYEAWERNPDLELTAARLDAAAAEARIAGAGLTPSLGFNFDASRRQQNFIGFPIPGSSAGVLTTRSTSYGVSLNTLWELDLWGRVRSGKRAALAEVQAAEADLRGAFLSLAAQAVKAWIAVAEANRQVELATATVRSYSATADKVRSRYERGLRSSLDLRLALNTLAAGEALLRERQLQQDRARRQLEILVGRYPRAAIVGRSQLPDMPPPVPAGLPSELLTRRLDLVTAERQLASTEARVAEAKAALYPRISLTASGGTSTRELVDLVSRDFLIWSLAANLAQPLLEGGRLRAGVALSKARSRQALANYQSALLRAFAEVESALAAEYWLREREVQLLEAAREARAAEALARDRYESGLEEFVTVLEAQRRALAAESNLITVGRLRLEARVDLHLSLGGGFEEVDPAPKVQTDPVPSAGPAKELNPS